MNSIVQEFELWCQFNGRQVDEKGAWADFKKQQGEKPAGKYNPPSTPEKNVRPRKKKKRLTMAKVYDTPLIPLEVGSMQTEGAFWYILDTDKPSAIKLYLTMLSAAITAPMASKKARKAYFKHIPEGEIPVWMPYGEGMKRANIRSKSSFKEAKDELLKLGLIQDTDVDSIYIIGKITEDDEWKSFLHLRMEELLNGTDAE